MLQAKFPRPVDRMKSSHFFWLICPGSPSAGDFLRCITERNEFSHATHTSVIDKYHHVLRKIAATGCGCLIIAK
jgi:hypothetical protein